MGVTRANSAPIFRKDTRPPARQVITPYTTSHKYKTVARNQATSPDQLGNLQSRRISPSSAVLIPTLPSLVMAAAKSPKKASWSAA